MPSTNPLRVTAALAAVLASACLGGGDTATTDQALSADQNGGQCDGDQIENLITNHDGACSGPWQFQQYPEREIAHEDCGCAQESCQPRRVSRAPIDATVEFKLGPYVGTMEATGLPGPFDSDTYLAVQRDFLAAFPAQAARWTALHTPVVSDEVLTRTSTGVYHWSATLTDERDPGRVVTIDDSSGTYEAWVLGTYSTDPNCTVEVVGMEWTGPTYQVTCYVPASISYQGSDERFEEVCTCTQYNTCAVRVPENGDPETAYFAAATEPNTEATLAAYRPWRLDGTSDCTTCDAPITDAAGQQRQPTAGEKLDCLLDQIEHGDYPRDAGATLPNGWGVSLADIIQRAKLVYERHGGDLSDAQRAEARLLYRTYPEPQFSPPCGRHTDHVNECPAFAEPELFDYCARMVSDHVDRRLWWDESPHLGGEPVFATCIGLFDRLDAATCTADDQTCSLDVQCCSGVCQDGACAAASCENVAFNEKGIGYPLTRIGFSEEPPPRYDLVDGLFDGGYGLAGCGQEQIRLELGQSRPVDTLTLYLDGGGLVTVGVADAATGAVLYQGTQAASTDPASQRQRVTVVFSVVPVDVLDITVDTCEVNAERLVEVEASHCQSQPAGCAAGSDQTTAAVAELRAIAGDAMTDLAGDLTARLVELGPLADDGAAIRADRTATIARGLSFVDRWYHAMRPLVGDTDADADLIATIALIHQHADDGNGGGTDRLAIEQANAHGDDARDALENSVAHAMTTDQLVIVAANQPGVMSGRPLVATVGETLAAFADRMDGQSYGHDVAWMLGGCDQSTWGAGINPAVTQQLLLTGCDSLRDPTPLSQAWHLLAEIDDGSRLAQAVATVPDLNGWQGVFAAIAANHDPFLIALRAELVRDPTGAACTTLEGNPCPPPYAADDYRGLDPATVPAPARKLVTTIRRASDRTASYQTSGMFAHPVGRYLHAPLDFDSRARIAGAMETRLTALDQSLQSYWSRVRQIVQDSSQTLANLSTQDRILAQLRSLYKEYARLEGQRDTQIRGFERHDQFEELSRDFSILKAAGTFAGHFTHDVPDAYPNGQLDLSARAAVFTEWRQFVEDVTAEPAIPVDGGQMLVLSIDDQDTWSPLCALSAVTYLRPNDAAIGDLPPAATGQLGGYGETGPEGYALTWTSQTFTAHNRTESETWSETTGFRNDACFNANAEVPGVDSLGFSESACHYVDVSYNHSDTTASTAGDESRTTLALTGGVHLPNTPFPLAPAGSLLILEMPRGANHLYQARDIHPVRGRTTTIMVRGDADLYLVVNDWAGDDQTHCPQSSGQLHISMELLTDAATGGARLLPGMAAALTEVRQRGQDVVARGDILPGERVSIEADARTALELGGTDWDRVDPVLRRLFDAFLQRELARIEGACRLEQTFHEMDVLADQINAALVDYQYAARTGALIGQLPSWGLRNLNLGELRHAAHGVSDLAVNYWLPVLALWYPNILAEARASAAAERLRQQLPGALMSDQAADLLELARLVQSGLGDPNLSGQATRIESKVRVRFPRPAPYPGAGTATVNRYKTIADVRASRVWAAALGNGEVTFRLDPADLYDNGTPLVNNALSCSLALPIVRKVGFAFVNDAHTSDPCAHCGDVDLTLGVHEDLTTIDGAVEYTIPIDAAYLGEVVPRPDYVFAHVGDDALALETRNPGVYSNPDAVTIGLSPFTTYNVNFSGVDPADLGGTGSDSTDVATELVMVMWIEGLRVTPDQMSWIDACR